MFLPAFGLAFALTISHAPFAVTDNGGVLVTRQALTVGQEVYSGGVARKVVQVHGSGGVYEIRVIPALPASDIGKTLVFST